MLQIELADPERALAVAYAPAAARSALTALFALDERMGAIVATTTEPTVGLIRLAWWREALERLDTAAPPAEPLLSTIAAELLSHGVTGGDLAEIEDGWVTLLESALDPAAIARHGRARGGTLFSTAGWLLGGGRSDHDDTLRDAGAGWALADLAHRHSNRHVRAVARDQATTLLATRRRWPAALRPLAMLAVLARHDAGAETRRQGAPRRVARMLALRLTGL